MPASRTYLLKNPVFQTSFFKEEDKRAMNLLLEGKQQSCGAEWRNLEGAFANVPLLPPDGMSWIFRLNMEDRGSSRV